MRRAGRFLGRAALQQRVLPLYRAAFVDALAAHCSGGLDLFAGSPRRSEAIAAAERLRLARWRRAANVHLLGGGAYFCYQRGLTRWLEQADPEVLILEANPRYLSSPRAIRWMHERGRPALGWGLGAPAADPFTGWLRRRLLRGLSAVIAYSTRGAAEYAAAGFPVARIYVAPNAVEAPPPRIPAQPPARRRSPRLIFVGRLQRRKRVDDLLAAVAAASPKPDLWIVGDGPDNARLASIAARLAPHAVFTGAVRGDDLRNLLDQADLFVLPGTGGLALQQAMARGLPIIAAQGDGSQEDMVTPDNGWLVPPNNPEALAEALQSALSRVDRWRSMGRASFRLAHERFHPQIMLDVFVRALRETVEGV
jgi:glycosyltransferase involved in cell wall biosynthesis